MSPLVQEVPVDVDAVRLGQVPRDQLAYGGEVLAFLLAAVLDVVYDLTFGAMLDV